MFSDWKKKIFSGWGFIRLVRLGIAISILNEAWQSSSVFFALFGIVFLFQALLNVGCCGSNGCDLDEIPVDKKSTNTNMDDVAFEEIK